MINFQVVVIFENSTKNSLETSYTILEDEISNYGLKNFNDIYNWFNPFFKKAPLDKFIDTSSFSGRIIKVDVKIGRITNALSGEYQTY
jgi:hypothetical protein